MTTTVEDLVEAGFVEYMYWGQIPNSHTYKESVQTMPGHYVHASAAEWCRTKRRDQREHPVVCFEIGRGWVANWGAMQFNVDTWYRLLQFCKVFNYEVDINTQESHL